MAGWGDKYEDTVMPYSPRVRGDLKKVYLTSRLGMEHTAVQTR